MCKYKGRLQFDALIVINAVEKLLLLAPMSNIFMQFKVITSCLGQSGLTL